MPPGKRRIAAPSCAAAASRAASSPAPRSNSVKSSAVRGVVSSKRSFRRWMPPPCTGESASPPGTCAPSTRVVVPCSSTSCTRLKGPCCKAATALWSSLSSHSSRPHRPFALTSGTRPFACGYAALPYSSFTVAHTSADIPGGGSSGIVLASAVAFSLRALRAASRCPAADDGGGGGGAAAAEDPPPAPAIIGCGSAVPGIDAAAPQRLASTWVAWPPRAPPAAAADFIMEPRLLSVFFFFDKPRWAAAAPRPRLHAAPSGGSRSGCTCGCVPLGSRSVDVRSEPDGSLPSGCLSRTEACRAAAFGRDGLGGGLKASTQGRRRDASRRRAGCAHAAPPRAPSTRQQTKKARRLNMGCKGRGQPGQPFDHKNGLFTTTQSLSNLTTSTYSTKH